jgi:hypothetical protein
VATIPGTVFTAGDNAYEEGTPAQFRDCYDPTWGAFRSRTRPTPGNHDWGAGSLEGYLAYFGSAAVNDAGKPWYSFDLGGWHVVALDSDCAATGGCGPDSPQGRWLAADLAASSAACLAGIWHKPRYSSGHHGGSAEIAALWKPLAAAGADIVLNGHDHDYERFAPMDAAGRAADDGVTEFVVGTGGAELRDFGQPQPNSLVRIVTHGVLELTLEPGGYAWRFHQVDGSIGDSGSGTCH